MRHRLPRGGVHSRDPAPSGGCSQCWTPGNALDGGQRGEGLLPGRLELQTIVAGAGPASAAAAAPRGALPPSLAHLRTPSLVSCTLSSDQLLPLTIKGLKYSCFLTPPTTTASQPPSGPKFHHLFLDAKTQSKSAVRVMSTHGTFMATPALTGKPRVPNPEGEALSPQAPTPGSAPSSPAKAPARAVLDCSPPPGHLQDPAQAPLLQRGCPYGLSPEHPCCPNFLFTRRDQNTARGGTRPNLRGHVAGQTSNPQRPRLAPNQMKRSTMGIRCFLSFPATDALQKRKDLCYKLPLVWRPGSVTCTTSSGRRTRRWPAGSVSGACDS